MPARCLVSKARRHPIMHLPSHDLDPTGLVIHELVCSRQQRGCVLRTARKLDPVIPGLDPDLAAAVEVEKIHAESLHLFLHLGGLVQLDVALDLDSVELLACYSEVGVHMIVMHLEVVIVYVGQLLEEEG
jgi:hypothetical protein